MHFSFNAIETFHDLWGNFRKLYKWLKLLNDHSHLWIKLKLRSITDIMWFNILISMKTKVLISNIFHPALNISTTQVITLMLVDIWFFDIVIKRCPQLILLNKFCYGLVIGATIIEVRKSIFKRMVLLKINIRSLSTHFKRHENIRGAWQNTELGFLFMALLPMPSTRNWGHVWQYGKINIMVHHGSLAQAPLTSRLGKRANRSGWNWGQG